MYQTCNGYIIGPCTTTRRRLCPKGVRNSARPPASFVGLSVDRCGLIWSGCRILQAAIKQGRADMATGTVKCGNSPKGLGFIEPEDGRKDVVARISGVERSG